MTDSDPIIYFNEATSAWPRAPGVIEAVFEALARPLGAPGRSAAPTDDAMGRCRQQLAAVLQVPDPTRIVLTTGATSALNLAIFGLRLPHVARVITSRAEHNSALRPLCSLRARKRIRLRIVGLDQHGDVNLEQFGAALRERASLVVLTHASNVTGRVFDVEPLFRMAKAAGAYTLLDAAQTIGVIPVLPEELHADLVAFSGHRGLRGPLGTGGLYVAPHIDLTPVLLGATEGHCEELVQPKDMPLRFQVGTPNVPEYIGLWSALRWWQEHGESCAREGVRLGNVLRTMLSRMRGVQVFGTSRAHARLPIISFRINGWSAAETGTALAKEFGIHCRAGLHCAPLVHRAIGSAPEGTVRLSLSGMNTEEQVQVALGAVRQLAARRRRSQVLSRVAVRL